MTTQIETARPSSRRLALADVPLHPILLAVAIVLSLWLESAVSPFAIARSFVGAILFAAALTVVASLAMRSMQRGGLVASGVIGLLWSKNLLETVTTAVDRLGAWSLAWLAAIGLAALLVGRLVWRRRRRLTVRSLTSVLNRAGALLLVAGLLLVIASGRAGVAVEDLRAGAPLGTWPASGADERSDLPDIHVLLLDGYPRADVLEAAFGIDNSEFLDALEDRGFSVASLAHSSYLWTHVTVPAALNLAYVEDVPALAPVAAGRVPQQPAIRRSIEENAAFDLARERGYATVTVASGFEHVTARQADVYVDGGHMTELEIALLASTFLGDILGAVAPDLASAQLRDRIQDNLEVLPEIAGMRDRPPALVFAHIPAPHQPVVFGEDGAPVAVPISEAYFGDSPMERGQDPDEFRERYRAQLPFLNDRILATIDGILAASERPPVIVLFADHGSASRTDWNATDPETIDRSILLERTGILFAAHTPGHPELYPDDATPVDLFRLLYDAYFGTDYGRATPPGGGEIPPVDPSVLDGG